MFPTMELLLRHSIQYFQMRGAKGLLESGNLDSVPRFLANLGTPHGYGRHLSLSLSLFLSFSLSLVLSPSLAHSLTHSLTRSLALSGLLL
eukprot:COSAG05_NODE_1184_length_5590_cov_57.730468_2_plen_90_part_00